MKIVYVIDSLKVGGAEVLLLSMVKDYQARGFDIAVAYFSDGPLRREFDALGIATHRISRHGLRNPLLFVRLLGLIWREKPDIVHTHLRKSDLAGQLCAALMRVPVRISTAHNADPWRRNRLLSFIDRTVTAGCHRVIAVSPEIRDYLLEVAGYQPDNVVAIPNGIDLKRFDPITTTALNPLELWGFDDDSPLIGIIGRLDPQKDHENFLNAARLVCDDFPAARFVVVGEGPLRQQLETRAGNLGLENQIRFTGIMRNMPELLATLDLVVFSSRWEGLPVALLEALAMNRAVVATSVGGIPGLINHEQTGLLVPPGDPEALAHGILKLLGDADTAQHVANQGRALVQAGFSVTSMHNKVLAIYTSVQAKTIATPDPRP